MPREDWQDSVSEFFPGSGPRVQTRAPRPGPVLSDLVLASTIGDRLEQERGLDLRDVDVIVRDAEVTLTGLVRSEADRRRIEDVAGIEGVRCVQNHLRVLDRHWTFF